MSKLKNIAFASSLFIFGLMAKLPAEEFIMEGDNYYPRYGNELGFGSSDWFALDRFKFTAEFLYWKASEDDLQLARADTFTSTTVAGVTTDTFTDSVTRTKFKWKPGQRYSLDYRFPCLEWDTKVVWTNFYSSATASASTTTGIPTPAGGTILRPLTIFTDAFFPTAIPVVDFDFAAVDGKWSLHFNNVDWTLGQRMDLGCGFSLKPYGGFRYTSIKQRYNTSASVIVTPGVISGVISDNLSTDYSGYGLVGGLCADWTIGCGFSIYANSSVGVTYGRIKAHDDRTDVLVTSVTTGLSASAADPTTISTLTFHSSDHIACPNIDLGIGLKWDYCICEFPVEIFAGWEYHHYFDQNAFGMAYGLSQEGDLILHGFNVGAGFSF